MRSDARLWARLVGEFRDAGARGPDRERHARRAVAIVRRERATGTARTFGPGDEIPYDVTRAYDLDGDTWVRLSADPDSRDMWRMPGFDPSEHESDAEGCYVTPHLLDKYGPLTEIPARVPRRRPAAPGGDRG
jgi:hypothetical protein